MADTLSHGDVLPHSEGDDGSAAKFLGPYPLMPVGSDGAMAPEAKVEFPAGTNFGKTGHPPLTSHKSDIVNQVEIDEEPALVGNDEDLVGENDRGFPLAQEGYPIAISLYQADTFEPPDGDWEGVTWTGDVINDTFRGVSPSNWPPPSSTGLGSVSLNATIGRWRVPFVSGTPSGPGEEYWEGHLDVRARFSHAGSPNGVTEVYIFGRARWVHYVSQPFFSGFAWFVDSNGSMDFAEVLIDTVPYRLCGPVRVYQRAPVSYPFSWNVLGQIFTGTVVWTTSPFTCEP